MGHIRRVQPDVVVTFGPDGAYGHPDHIAISQFTTAAIIPAADALKEPCDGLGVFKRGTQWAAKLFNKTKVISI